MCWCYPQSSTLHSFQNSMSLNKKFAPAHCWHVWWIYFIAAICYLAMKCSTMCKSYFFFILLNNTLSPTHLSVYMCTKITSSAATVYLQNLQTYNKAFHVYFPIWVFTLIFRIICILFSICVEMTPKCLFLSIFIYSKSCWKNQNK